MTLVILILIFALFLLPSIMLGRKQRQHQQRIAELQASIAVGDYIVTGAGMYGTVVSVDDDLLGVEIADGVVIALDRASVLRRVEDSPASDVEQDSSSADTMEDSHPENIDEHPDNQ